MTTPAQQERAAVLSMVKDWTKHERACGNMKGAMLLINLRFAIERGDHHPAEKPSNPNNLGNEHG